MVMFGTEPTNQDIDKKYRGMFSNIFSIAIADIIIHNN